jgi:DNA-binding NarL/FixJ family response regulator
MDDATATQLWRQLELGSWSVVDQVDHERRCFLFAQENALEARVARALTEREREVVVFASRGLSNKVIAYELGVTSSTVSTHLSHAAAKLGLASRAAIIETYLALTAAQVSVSYVGWAGKRYAVLAMPRRFELPDGLSAAEREVVARAARGESNAAIARVRAVSVRTVENQLASAMRKLGVTSRANLTAFLASRAS